MAEPFARPAWLPPDFIALTDAKHPTLGVFVNYRGVVAVEDVGGAGGSLVRLPAATEPLEVLETPQQVFAAITKASA